MILIGKELKQTTQIKILESFIESIKNGKKIHIEMGTLEITPKPSYRVIPTYDVCKKEYINTLNFDIISRDYDVLQDIENIINENENL
jgi:hypothetical protein